MIWRQAIIARLKPGKKVGRVMCQPVESWMHQRYFPTQTVLERKFEGGELVFDHLDGTFHGPIALALTRALCSGTAEMVGLGGGSSQGSSKRSSSRSR